MDPIQYYSFPLSNKYIHTEVHKYAVILTKILQSIKLMFMSGYVQHVLVHRNPATVVQTYRSTKIIKTSQHSVIATAGQKIVRALMAR
jgi:hypothetical protein